MSPIPTTGVIHAVFTFIPAVSSLSRHSSMSQRSLFGPPGEDINKSRRHALPLPVSPNPPSNQHSSWSLSSPVRSEDLPRLLHLFRLQPSREVPSCWSPSLRRPAEEPARTLTTVLFLSRIIVVINTRYSSILLNYSAGVNCRYSETYTRIACFDVL